MGEETKDARKLTPSKSGVYTEDDVIEAYRMAYREAAELIEDLKGENVGARGDHWAGCWAAFRVASQEHAPFSGEL